MAKKIALFLLLCLKPACFHPHSPGVSSITDIFLRPITLCFTVSATGTRNALAQGRTEGPSLGGSSYENKWRKYGNIWRIMDV